MENRLKHVIDFFEESVRTYDATEPGDVFSACLLEFMIKYDKGILHGEQSKINEIIKLNNSHHKVDHYLAGKYAYHFIKGHPQFAFRFRKQ